MEEKTQEIINFRKANPYAKAPEFVVEFGISRQRVHSILKHAGVPTAALKYSGKPCHIKEVPEGIVESVKKRAKDEGLNFRLVSIKLWEKYGKGEIGID